MATFDVISSVVCGLGSVLIERLDVVFHRSDVIMSVENKVVDVSSPVDKISVVVSGGPDFVGMFSE